MAHLLNELRILQRKAIYPDTGGTSLRVLNIARLAQGVIQKTTVFSMDNAIDFEGLVDGIRVIQEKELHSEWERIGYHFRALTSRELIVPYTKKAFTGAENSMFQIGDPLLYPLLKKNGIASFILDENNVNWEMYGIPQTDLKKEIYVRVAFRRDKENEKRALRAAAHVLCCSARDRDMLVGEVPEIENRISVIPNCVDIRKYSPAENTHIEHPDISGKNRVIFIGTMSHQPNADAVRLICSSIAPSCNGCQFIVVGRNPPNVRCPGNVSMTGYITDIRPVVADADICIAPIRSGSGTRLKILEYMAMGKPVISTSKGAEGIDYTHGLNIIIEDQIEKYPEIIHGLLADEKCRASLGREARKLIEEKYDWELYRKPLERIYRDVMGETG